jgi:ABC-2 type transport system ATP-binding protein
MDDEKVIREKVIEVRNLYKRFGSFVANRDLTFDVYAGEIFGFLGANGAGKTTAMRILCGLSRPSSGEIKVAGLDVYKQVGEIKKNIGYMSQKFSLYEDLTVYENMRLYGGIYGLSRAQIAVRAADLLDMLGFAHARNTLIRDIPLGWRQKLAFSVAVIHRPGIVFLDEPTGGVDPLTRRQFWEMIHRTAAGGTTVFVTTHYMDEAEYCDRVSIMVDGEIRVIGSPSELIQRFGASGMDDVFLKLARSKTTEV